MSVNRLADSTRGRPSSSTAPHGGPGTSCLCSGSTGNRLHHAAVADDAPIYQGVLPVGACQRPHPTHLHGCIRCRSRTWTCPDETGRAAEAIFLGGARGRSSTRRNPRRGNRDPAAVLGDTTGHHIESLVERFCASQEEHGEDGAIQTAAKPAVGRRAQSPRRGSDLPDGRSE